MQRINYKQQYDPRSLGLLVKLPAEIIGMIFSEFEDVEDIVYLACTNTRLMILGEKHLREFMYCPSWEGDRIICVGDYAVNDDLPEGVISQEFFNSISGCKEGEEEREEVDLTFIEWARSNFDQGPLQHIVLEKIGWAITSDFYEKSRVV